MFAACAVRSIELAVISPATGREALTLPDTSSCQVTLVDPAGAAGVVLFKFMLKRLVLSVLPKLGGTARANRVSTYGFPCFELFLCLPHVGFPIRGTKSQIHDHVSP